MLSQLSIVHYVLIEKLTLNFQDGLLVFTGETGAGKSIIMDAIGLALGKRAEPHCIKEGAERCEVSCLFDIRQRPDIQAYLDEQALTSEEYGDCILRRIITRDGRSRAFINGIAVTLQQLRDLGQQLVVIHGQHEHQLLLQAEKQQALLDNAGKHRPLALTVREHYREYSALKEAIAEKEEAQKSLAQQQAFLRFQLDEFSALNLQADELPQLEREQKKWDASQSLIQTLSQVCEQLEGDDEAILKQLRTLCHKLSTLTTYDETLSHAHQQFESLRIQLEEGHKDLQHYLSDLEPNPERLQELDERLSQIYQLARKHHCLPESLPTLEQNLLTQLANLDANEESLSLLREKCEQSLKAYQESAKTLSLARKVASEKLSASITAYMPKLGMKGGNFKVQLENTASSHPSPFGNERVVFMVCTNPGSALLPMSKIVSGGELSRLSLALVLTASQNDAKLSMIFDEVDAGIGGATAACIGDLLRSLSSTQQVLCITHAPQIASQGHQHFCIKKSVKQKQTEVTIEALSSQQRIEEIARMLGRDKITETSLAHAKELLLVAE